MGIDGKPRIQRTLSDTSVLKSKRAKDTVDRYNNRRPIGSKNSKSSTDVPNPTQGNEREKEIFTPSTFHIDSGEGFNLKFIGEDNKTSGSDSSEDELNFDGTIYRINVGDKTHLCGHLTSQKRGNKIHARRRRKRPLFENKIKINCLKDLENEAMNYRGPSRTTTTNYYLHDAWMSRKGVAPKRESKLPQYSSGFYQPQYFDTPTKYRTRQGAISPNLPKLPYLEKTNLSYSPVRHLPKNSKVVFKNRANCTKQPVRENDSKKSITDHTLMKTLLSGLSIFDSQSRLDFVPTKQNVHNHKSMGNIKTTTKEDFSLDVYPNPKSSVDFTELQSRKNTKVNLKEPNCCRRVANVFDQRQNLIGKDKYQLDYVGDFRSADTSQQCLGGSQCFRLDCESDTYRNGSMESNNFAYNVGKKAHVTSSEECLSDKFKNRVIKPPPNKLNIVQERKRFFENKKVTEKGNFRRKIAPNSQDFVVNCVEKKVQRAYGKPDEITEIYRNFQSVHSTSTISKRSSSVPPIKNYGGRSNPRNVELFNPDYNFDNRNRMGVRKSLIGSIRSKVFQSGSDDYTYEAEEWHGGPILPRFPKETRTAMSIILSNRNSNVSCRYCQERMKARQVVSIETQTSPVVSRQNIDTSPSDPKIPCMKNLLCDKGHHAGRCEKIVRDKLTTSCTEGCVCRSKGRMIRYEKLIWPGHPNYLVEPLEATERADCGENELIDEEFLKYIRVDLETSTETIPNERNGGGE